MVTPLSKEGEEAALSSAENLLRPGLVDSVSHHGDTVTLKESDSGVPAKPGFELNIALTH